MVEQLEKGRLVFLVHKHQATTLHDDFRLEIGGVMPSRAIPKGPTLDPPLKRLAMPTVDHTLEYRYFEGLPEEGRYGARPVMVSRVMPPMCPREKRPKASGKRDQAGRS